MYLYTDLKPQLFTDEGQRMFLQVRDKAKKLLSDAGAFNMASAIRGCVGNSWLMLACVDRLVELGEIREITSDAPGQYRVFVEA